MTDLTPDESQCILTQAQLAKTEEHIQYLRAQAQRILQEPMGGIQVTSHQAGHAVPRFEPIEIKLDLINMQPGQFSQVAAQLDQILAELERVKAVYGQLSFTLRDLQTRTNVRATFEFKRK